MLLNLLNCFYSCKRIKTYKTTVSKTAQARQAKSIFNTRKLTHSLECLRRRRNNVTTYL